MCIIWPFTFGEFFKIKTKRDSKCSRRDNSAAKNYEVTQITAPQLRVDYLSNDREPVQRFNYRFYFCIFSSVLFSALCIPGFFRFYFPFASAWTKDLMTPHVPEYELSFGFHYRAWKVDGIGRPKKRPATSLSWFDFADWREFNKLMIFIVGMDFGRLSWG